MLAASLERISIGLLLIREYNIFLLGKLARLVMGTIFLVTRARASEQGNRRAKLATLYGVQPRDIYIDGVRMYVQNASCYFSKLKLCSRIIVRTYVTLAL